MSQEDAGDEVGEKVQSQLDDAINTIISGNDKSMVVKWVCLVEAMDADGERGLWTLTSDDVKAWDTAGMLQHGLHLQQMQALAEAMSGADPDDD